MKDSADPLDGWSLPEILKQNARPASNDVYGKLYRHLPELLQSFHRSLSARPFSFRLLHMDASDLADHLRGEPGFDRIEVKHQNPAAHLSLPTAFSLPHSSTTDHRLRPQTSPTKPTSAHNLASPRPPQPPPRASHSQPPCNTTHAVHERRRRHGTRRNAASSRNRVQTRRALHFQE